MSDRPSIQLLTTHDVAGILGWSLRRVQRLFNSGAFPTVRIGSRVVRVRKEVFEDWTQGRVQKPEPAASRNVPEVSAADVIAIHQFSQQRRRRA